MTLGTSNRRVGIRTGAGDNATLGSSLFDHSPWSHRLRPKKLLCGSDTSPCLGPYSTVTCPEFQVSCRLGRELFTLPTYKVVYGEIIEWCTMKSVWFSMLGLIAVAGHPEQEKMELNAYKFSFKNHSFPTLQHAFVNVDYSLLLNMLFGSKIFTYLNVQQKLFSAMCIIFNTKRFQWKQH